METVLKRRFIPQIDKKELEGRIGAPSVQMMDVPRENVSEHTGFFNGSKEGQERPMEWQDELDVRLAQHSRFVYHLQSQTSSYHSNRHRHLSPSSSQSSPSTSDDERDMSDDDREYDSDNSHYSSALRSTRSTRSQARNALNTNDSRGDSSRRSHQPQPQASSTSSASAARKRMSILTNMVFDISLCSGNTTTTMTAEQYVGSKDGKMGRRRFFFDTGTSSELEAMNGLRANGIHVTDTLPSSRGASPFITGGGSVSARSVREATEDLGDMGDEDTIMMMDSRAGTPR
ncbi:hypothetical protein EV359DRAFT_79141 [Lentinula novae-zelandiae]|nr:hypothetical protein EV359DRAFT_79141 [Lentinula novae-zelandiae]